MPSRQSTIAVLTVTAGLAVGAPALAQFESKDPVVQASLKRVYPIPGGGGPQDAGTGPDVIVGEIQAWGDCCPDSESVVIPTAATVGATAAYGLGTSSCNISSAANNGRHLLWIAMTPYHPIIPQNMYRLKTVNGSTRFEQLGQSWSKYAFVALDFTVCGGPCTNSGSVLGMGCSDPYTWDRNATQSTAGPRYQCNPFTGVFPDGNAVRNAWPSTGGSSLARRLQVPTADLAAAGNPGALYFGECMYISRDDACWGNGKNNASYRRFTVGASNTITLQGAIGGAGTQRTKPAIFAWRDHGGGTNVVDNNVMVTEVTCGNTFFTQPAYPYISGGQAGAGLVLPAGDGWVYVASRATDIGGGLYHYEYAVENLNSDRGIGSFSVNFPAGTVITNAAIRQINCHSGVAADDTNRNAAWTQSIGSTSISWTTPHTFNAGTPELGSYIRWGTMYNFRFDANVAPTQGNAGLGYFKPLSGYANTINAAAHVPGSGTPTVCYANCDGSTGSPMLTANDFQCFINAFSLGQSYANCDQSTGNPQLTGNDFSCFINQYALGCT